MSDGEKLIAFMLADIMKSQKVEGEIDPDFVTTAIAGDDLWALKWKYGGLFETEGPSDDIVDETAKIMTMCRVVENSINQLSPDERDKISERERTVFVGFDGNEEPHFGVASMFVEKLDRFTEWADRSMNSHHNTIEKYRSMKRVYDGLPRSTRGLLDLDGIKAVLAAERV